MTNIDGLATQNNIIDRQEGADAGDSLRKKRNEKVYDIHELDRESLVTINPVRKYNRTLRSIENGDGKTIDIQGLSLDIYTYTILMMLNPNVEYGVQQNLSQLCMLVPIAQAFMAGVFFWSETNELREDEFEVILMPVKMYYDFGFKFLCCLFMHMIVNPDLKQALELMNYLKKPTSMEHVNSSRFISCLVLLMKFSIGVIIETIMIFHLSALSEESQDLRRIMVTFIIYLVIYEVPTLFFKLKHGQNQALYAQYVQAYNEIRVHDLKIDKMYGIDRESQRANDVDCGISMIHCLLREAYMICYVYSYFYLIVLF